MWAWLAAPLGIAVVFSAIVGELLNLWVLYEWRGGVGILLGIVFFPLAYLIAPWAAGLAWGVWLPLAVSWGIPMLLGLANFLVSSGSSATAPTTHQPTSASAPPTLHPSVGSQSSPSSFCSQCGYAAARDDELCRHCGAIIEKSRQLLAPVPRQQSASSIDAPRLRPTWLVVALTVATLGIYPIVWTGITWGEMKRVVRDNSMDPFGHAVAMLVPIYGLFRLHAHFDTINRLLGQAGTGRSVSPGAAVAGSIAATILSGVISPLGLAIAAWVVASGQVGLNSYWATGQGRLAASPTRAWEWCTLAVGGVVISLMLIQAVGSASGGPSGLGTSTSQASRPISLPPVYPTLAPAAVVRGPTPARTATVPPSLTPIRAVATATSTLPVQNVIFVMTSRTQAVGG